MDLQLTVVLDETQLPEPIHEEANTRAGCAHHLCKGLLTDFRNVLADQSVEIRQPGLRRWYA